MPVKLRNMCRTGFNKHMANRKIIGSLSCFLFIIPQMLRKIKVFPGHLFYILLVGFLLSSTHVRALAEVYYVGNSGWIVVEDRVVIVFDYYLNLNGEIHNDLFRVISRTEDEIDEVHVFISCKDSLYYNPLIFNWKTKAELNYYTGFDSEHALATQLLSNKNYHKNSIEIETIKSTLSGLAFYVQTPNLSMFHTGKHILTDSTKQRAYVEELNYLSEQTNYKADLVFLSCKGKSFWEVTGALYTIERLHPEYVFPMNCGGREELYREFAIQVSKVQSKLMTASVEGQFFKLDD